MKYSEIKALKDFCEGLHSEPAWREVLDYVLDGDDDFLVNNVRFIHEDSILDILASELTSDLYLLGCFSSWFIAEQMNWPEDLIKAAQGNEDLEALGEAIADNADMQKFAEAYASADGYGHHFNHYDGSEEEVTVNGVTYYVFDNC